MSGQSIGANPMKQHETNLPLPDALPPVSRLTGLAFAHRGGAFVCCGCGPGGAYASTDSEGVAV